MFLFKAPWRACENHILSLTKGFTQVHMFVTSQCHVHEPIFGPVDGIFPPSESMKVRPYSISPVFTGRAAEVLSEPALSDIFN
jgi:hypothetical protein